MTRIGLFGAAGHMGTTLIRAISASGDCDLAGGCDRPGSPAIGTDLGVLAGLPPLGLLLTDDPAALCRASDVVVDYSAASATMALLAAAVAERTPVLVCTTGFDAAQQADLEAAGRRVPVLVGANMSSSVIAMYALVRMAAQLLGDEFDIEIFDFHPWDKIDAPSGTALELANCAAEGRGVALAEMRVPARSGETGKRRRGSIGFSSARGRAGREHGLLRRSRPAAGDHQPGHRSPGLGGGDAGGGDLAGRPGSGPLCDGGHAGRLTGADAAPTGTLSPWPCAASAA